MHTFRQPDIKAPRYRPKCKHLLSKKFVEEFKAKYPQYANVTKEDIEKIIRTFGKKVKQVVMEERNGVELPAQIGFMFIGSTKPDTSANFNYRESAKHGKPLKYSNLATDGYVAKIFYCNYAEKYKFSFRELWAFTATKEFKKESSVVYKEEFEKYIVIDNRKQISHIFDSQMKREYHKSKMQERLEGYDEFEL